MASAVASSPNPNSSSFHSSNSNPIHNHHQPSSDPPSSSIPSTTTTTPSNTATNGVDHDHDHEHSHSHSHGQNGVEEQYDVDEDLSEAICGGCKKLIGEGAMAGNPVISFANQLWHVDCFRCAKCGNPVDTERDDILLLSDGHPICGQCNYSCQICGQAIMEEAIMTGDESYHASCFTCRSCHLRIEELVFAKTSQGIYCMKCHNERVARSRRHAEKRSKAAKQREQQLARAAASNGNGSSGNASASESKDSTLSPSGELNRSTSPSRNGGNSSPIPNTRSSSDGRNGISEDSAATPSTSVTSPGTAADGRSLEGTPRSMGTPSILSKDHGTDSPAVSSSSTTDAWGSSSPSLSSNNRLGTGSGSGSVGPRPSSAGQGASAKKTPPTLREMRGAGPSYSNVNRDRAGSSSAVPPSSSSQIQQSSSNQSNGSSSQLQSSETAPASLDGLSDSHSRVSIDRSETASSASTANTTLLATSSSSPALGSSSPSPDNVGLGIVPPLKSSQAASTPTVTVNTASSPTLGETSSPRSQPSKASHFSMDSEADLDASTSAQLKRASRLSVNDMQSLFSKSVEEQQPTSSNALRRSSKTYSFYDPDFINLMDSFGQFDSTDDFKLHSPKSPKDARKKTQADPSPPESSKALNRISVQLTPPQDDGSSIAESSTHSSNLTKVDENLQDKEVEDDEEEEYMNQNENRRSTSSLNTISAKMRESMKAAKGGHVSMDTSFVETILRDLDETKQRMKELQTKFDRIKRRSQQAAQGFSMAKQDFHAEVQARHEAELEMAALKRQLVEQASKLTSMATEKKQQEHLQNRSKEVRSTLQGMERDLAKLTVERDLTVAEVAELVALQDGNSFPKDSKLTSESAAGIGNSLSRNLSVRLEGVKEKYRKEIDELTFERDALLIEIEELKQSKEVFLEETHALNARNDELNTILSQLTRRVDIANQSHGLSRAPPVPNSGGSNPTRLGSSQGNGGGFGFGFGKQNRGLGSTSPGAQDGGIYPNPTAASDPAVPFDTTVQRAFKPEKIEPAPTAKKFKWMKPKLTESAKNAAAALPMGHSPPVPPKFAGSLNSSSMGPPGSNQNASLNAPAANQHQQSGLQVSSSAARASSNEIVVREHLFHPFNVLRPIRCFACQKNMWGQSEVRCALCGQACHQRCLQNLPTSCNQPFSRGDENLEPIGPSMFGKDLVEQVAFEGSEIPLVVEKCIQAVEMLGMDYEGIYRKSGGTSQLRVITQLFERGQPFDLEDTDRFNDVSAVTSVLKNYFRELPTPLLTFHLHEKFIQASEIKNDPALKQETVLSLIDQLPRQHFATLRALILHLHRVQQRSEENRMNSRNLGVVFGPTLMRSGDPSQEFAHMGGKAMTIEYFIDNPQLFQDP